MDESKCPLINRDLLNNAFIDLCWALFSNQIQTNASASLNEELNYSSVEWSMVFEKLNNNRFKNDGLLTPDCNCCIQKRRKAVGKCKWTWRDKCQQIPLLRELEFQKF